MSIAKSIYHTIGIFFIIIFKFNKTINELIDADDMVQNSLGKIVQGDEDGEILLKRAENADKAIVADSADKLTKLVKINDVDFDGTKDITIKDDTKISKDEDFVLKNQESLTFADKMCTIADERITADSLADIYFTTDTITEAEKAVISVEIYEGYLTLVAQNAPAGTIKASKKIMVV